MRRVPIRTRSQKLARLQRVYSKLRRDFLIENPWCAVGGEEATEVHHRAGRVGADLLDVSRWLPVCHTHHVQITENPAWAIEKGYSLPRIGCAP